jgi:hypothetical protein
MRGSFLAGAADRILLGAFVLLSLPALPANGRQASFNPASVPVYVGELELHAVTRPDALQAQPRAASPGAGQPGAPKPVTSELDTPAKQAAAIVESLRASLIEALAKAGYKAQPSPAARPSSGVELRAVFAEPDEMNRVRRSILGTAAKSPKFLLFVSLANLAKPEQPFYQSVAPNPAVPGAHDNRYGPVITMSSYAPVAKFEVNKNPSAEELEKIAQAIAAEADALIRANPLAVTRP